ncbi:hypothetical protein OROMI_030616 [Orobanche minor]
MLKVVPNYRQSGTSWDHNGKSKISQIFIACSKYRIDSIQFAYVEQDGNVVLSERIGKIKGFENLKTITFDYPSEYITRVSGSYETYYHGKRYLSSITFDTNERKYGPYKPFLSDSGVYNTVYEFDYEVGGEFYGFFGTDWRDDGGGIETIGFYMKPLQVADRSGSDRATVTSSVY